jgi:hypothetical protein
VHEVDDAFVQPGLARVEDALGDVREDRVGGSLSCGEVSPGSRFSMKYFGCSDLPRSW